MLIETGEKKKKKKKGWRIASFWSHLKTVPYTIYLWSFIYELYPFTVESFCLFLFVCLICWFSTTTPQFTKQLFKLCSKFVQMTTWKQRENKVLLKPLFWHNFLKDINFTCFLNEMNFSCKSSGTTCLLFDIWWAGNKYF